jgi:hypothetical protein
MACPPQPYHPSTPRLRSKSYPFTVTRTAKDILTAPKRIPTTTTSGPPTMGFPPSTTKRLPRSLPHRSLPHRLHIQILANPSRRRWPPPHTQRLLLRRRRTTIRARRTRRRCTCHSDIATTTTTPNPHDRLFHGGSRPPSTRRPTSPRHPARLQHGATSGTPRCSEAGVARIPARRAALARYLRHLALHIRQPARYQPAVARQPAGHQDGPATAAAAAETLGRAVE